MDGVACTLIATCTGDGLYRDEAVCAGEAPGFVCVPTAQGTPGVTTCVLGKPVLPVVDCEAWCGEPVAACTPMPLAAFNKTVTRACNCRLCERGSECGDTEYCGHYRGACVGLLPAWWSVLSIAVAVPELNAKAKPWDVDSPPDLQVEFLLDKKVWVTSSVAMDTASASWVSDASHARILKGSETFEVDIYEVDAVSAP